MDDELKSKVLAAVLAFNVVIISYQIFFNYSNFSWAKFFLGALIAGVAAGGAFAAVHFSKK